MEDNLDGRQPRLKTTSMEDNLNWDNLNLSWSQYNNSTSIEDDLEWRQPLWKTTAMEDVFNGRQPQWKMTLMKTTQWKNILMEDKLNGRQHLWKKTSLEDDLGLIFCHRGVCQQSSSTHSLKCVLASTLFWLCILKFWNFVSKYT